MRIRLLTLFLCTTFLSNILVAQTGYSDYAKQTSRLKSIANANASTTKLVSLGKTSGGKDIWMLTIGTGETSSHPAIAVIGGTEGSHILGTELAIGFAESLLQNSNSDSIKAVLAKTTYYVFPNMSPDAMEQYFAAIKYERLGNASVTDEDRDGKTNEDPYEDLDGNGKITWMRIESPVGEYKTHPDDPRILIKADITKGEKGKYLLLSEGMDNDKDGVFNEDGDGGVQFNKNMTYKHPSFSQGSGEFPVSENESRVLLDQLFELFNIYAVISFGTNNNLSSPVSYNPAAANQRIVAGWLEADTKVSSLVSDLYIKTGGGKDAPKTAAMGGDFVSWGYYHYARFSFSTPGWWPPKAKPDTTKKEKAFTIDDASANFLRWSAQQGINDNYTDWKAYPHPDFPNQKVEIGGIDPFVMSNPPYKLVGDLVKKHTDFLIKLSAFQPAIDIVNVKTEKLGNGLTRISCNIINTGALPSHTKLGERSYWVKKVVAKLTLVNGQTIISGQTNKAIDTIEGYGTKQLTWVIKGNGKVKLDVGSPSTGSKSIDISL